MRISLMNGGLGNQMFQYIFYRWLELNTSDSCIIDDSDFFNENYEHNGFELEKIFNLKPKLLSQVFTEELWMELLHNRTKEKSIPQLLHENGFNLTMFAETTDYSFSGNIIMMPPNIQNETTKYSVKNVVGNFYYHGYWITNDWLDDIFPTIKNEFCFPELMESKNLDYLKRINETESCGIHIRRGDFVKLQWALGTDYYFSAVDKIKDYLGNDGTFFVFSDDINWCQQNEEALGLSPYKNSVTYVEGNSDNKTNYIDMQLLSECKWMVMSNSSFSYMAALLDNHLKGEVNPTPRRITHHTS